MEILTNCKVSSSTNKNYHKNNIPFLHRCLKVMYAIMHVGSVTDLLRERKK